MRTCDGKPAERYALAYFEGSLPEDETEAFEQHYFDCPVCAERLQTMRAASHVLAREPAVDIEALRRKRFLGRRRFLDWIVPAPAWALAAAAVLLVLGIFLFHRPATPPQPQLAQLTPPPAPLPVAAAPARQADFVMPVFAAPELRAEREDPYFKAGRTAYAKGDYPGAIAKLRRVPGSAQESLAARFYIAACLMKQGDLDGAAAGFDRVARAGDSPQLESALYYLAQIALAQGKLGEACRRLNQTIALRGDLEAKARSQVAALQGPGTQSGSR